ncbi:rhodanese-like domain-containing protein [Advenella mimigardefordensis]|uniref:Rhodanese domain-containing protein n=1 Tax=Advenella mimigardefordensis (strain DSM 17166 / LMG 22922 / DPN7) TaxID=1247726 RepID=W0PH37_ADVMD|nr:rhodanese-like domain-containing protein [Advenella mimigardefordensis]AHG65801.1 rhodanese domain-containing protein [Advenella mimigardefordensis DPN7]
MKYINAHALKQQIHDTDEIAVLDIREHGQYGENHLFFAVSVPYSALELNIERLVPRKNTRIVMYGNQHENDVAERACLAATALGYTNISILQDGVQGWQAAGYATFAGVNLPSKTFGELAEHVYDTPRISAQQLQALLRDDSNNIVVLDGRPVPEYKKMNIPGSVCCPNGELALRAGELAPDPATTIVINCAGRTRSIVGAQTLINLGVPNKVYALENGTQGWYLADLPLEHQSDRLYPRSVQDHNLPTLQRRSATLAARHNVQAVDAAQVQQWLAQSDRTTFLCDVRTPEEFGQDKLPAGVQHTPGGQLIQATDEFIGVRKSRLVLLDFDKVRAPVIASWLRQLGWEAYLLQHPGQLQITAATDTHHQALRNTTVLTSDQIASFISAHPEAMLIDTRPSMQFRRLRLQGAIWAIRPTVTSVVPKDKDKAILLIGEHADKLHLVAADLERAGHTRIYMACLDSEQISRSGLALDTDEAVLPDEQCIDFLFFVHDRHQGNKEAARKYLEWETNLISQIDDLERQTFSFD